MSVFEFLIGNRALTDAFGWAIVHSLWQITLIALLCGLLLGVLRKTNAYVRYNTALAFMGAALLAFISTFIRLYEPSRPVTTWAGPSNVRFTFTQKALFVYASPTRWENCHTLSDYYFFIMQWLGAQLPVVVAIWCIGTAIFSIRLGIGLLQTHRLRTIGICAVPEGWEHSLKQLANRMQLCASVRLVESARVQAPMVIGWLRPIILFPVGLLTALPLQEIEGILAHELAHIRRHDFVINVCQSVVEVLLFYHPAIWWLSAQINHERENCCDDLAIAATGNKLAYVKALANLADLLARPQIPDYAISAAGKPKSGLLQRIMRIAQPNSVNQWALQSFPIRFAVALTLFCSLVLFTSSTQATKLAAEVKSKAHHIMHRAEAKLGEFFNLSVEDTTKKARQKMTVIKKDGERRDTILVEADEITVNFDDQITLLKGKPLIRIYADSVLRYNASTIHPKIDSLIRRFYVRTDGDTFQWNSPNFETPLYDHRNKRWIIVHSPPLNFSFKLNGKEFENKVKVFADTIILPFAFEREFDRSREKEQQILLNKALEELRRNRKLSEKQLKEAEQALQEAVKAARKAEADQRKRLFMNMNDSLRLRMADEYAKIDSLLRLKNRQLIDVRIQVDSLKGAAMKQIIIDRGITLQDKVLLSSDAEYFIDGKAATKAEFDKIKPSQIKTITIEKKEGQRGVIRITTTQEKD